MPQELASKQLYTQIHSHEHTHSWVCSR